MTASAKLKFPIYLDNHATTPVDPRVFEVMRPYFVEKFGNAASLQHGYGKEAFAATEGARQKVAELIGAAPEEIIFTSGATESNNLAILGVLAGHGERGDHLITAATEHPSVLETCRYARGLGFELTELPVQKDGRVDPQELQRALRPNTVLVSLMTANNEIGTLHPIREIGKMLEARGVLFHTDAAQAIGRIPVSVKDSGIDLLSLSSHKFYGPKGAGALYVRSKSPRVKLEPVLRGGGHEWGLRSGTLNVPAIVGFGEAAALAGAALKEEPGRLTRLRDRLLERIQSRLDGVGINGSMEYRLPNNLNLSFAYVEGESLLKNLKNLAVASSSACAHARFEVSYVLRAIGLEESLIHSSVRFGLGRFNTQEEIDTAADLVVEEVTQLREGSTLYRLTRESASEIQLARKPGEISRNYP